MMGKALVNTDVPTAKGSSGILIMNDKEAKRGEVQPCIRCAKCVSACPMGLEPYLLATVSAHGDFERVEKKMSCRVSSVAHASSLVLPTVRCWTISVWVRVR